MLLDAAELAGDQFSVLGLDDMRVIGLSDRGTRQWVAAGHLHRLWPGVFAFGRPDVSAEGRRFAAILACGERAALSFATAGAALGARSSASAYIDVTVPLGRPLRRLKGIRCHRADLAPQDITDANGIPCTSLARTLLDLATLLGDEALRRAASQAEGIGIFDMREMEDLLRRSKGHRGIRRLRRVLESGDISGDDSYKSNLEIRFEDLCVKAGLPKPGVNRWLLLGDTYRQVDFLWRKEKVVIETDGGPWHSNGWQKASDDELDRLLDAHGFLHMRLPDTVVDDSPHEAVARAQALLRRRVSNSGA